MKRPEQDLLAILLAVELSTEELRSLTVACVGAPKLDRVAQAAESAIAIRDNGEADIGRLMLVNAVLDGEVVTDPNED